MIEAAVIIAFMVYFTHYTFTPNQIFGKIAEWLEERISDRWTQPLFNCPICMTPWWGAGYYLLGYYAGVFEVFDLSIIFILFTASGINVLNVQFTRIADTLKNKFDPDE